MCYSSTHPVTPLHVTQFYQAFSHVSIASNKRWGEKAWVRGYPFPTNTASRQHQEAQVQLCKIGFFVATDVGM